jgi:hypothetical protein
VAGIHEVGVGEQAAAAAQAPQDVDCRVRTVADDVHTVERHDAPQRGEQRGLVHPLAVDGDVAVRRDAVGDPQRILVAQRHRADEHRRPAERCVDVLTPFDAQVEPHVLRPGERAARPQGAPMLHPQEVLEMALDERLGIPFQVQTAHRGEEEGRKLEEVQPHDVGGHRGELLRAGPRQQQLAELVHQQMGQPLLEVNPPRRGPGLAHSSSRGSAPGGRRLRGGR